MEELKIFKNPREKEVVICGYKFTYTEHKQNLHFRSSEARCNFNVVSYAIHSKNVDYAGNSAPYIKYVEDNIDWLAGRNLDARSIRIGRESWERVKQARYRSNRAASLSDQLFNSGYGEIEATAIAENEIFGNQNK